MIWHKTRHTRYHAFERVGEPSLCKRAQWSDVTTLGVRTEAILNIVGYKPCKQCLKKLRRDDD